tara:strand:- start:512 stop:706 length:195 start_codon:yes stop_codon:yes gene_type:complete
MSHFGDLLGGKTTPAPAAKVAKSDPAPKRARSNKGHYIADDPSTPENEAWVGGKAPVKLRSNKK